MFETHMICSFSPDGPNKPDFSTLVGNRQAVAIFRAILSEDVKIFIEEKTEKQQTLRNHTLFRNLAEGNSPLIASVPIILHQQAKELMFTINFNKSESPRWIHWIDIEINPLFSY
jgi:ABC-type lipoprotein export system ATPase subunit